jgi:hypothetical protein
MATVHCADLRLLHRYQGSLAGGATTLSAIETTNAIVFTNNAGSYTLTFDQNGWNCPGETSDPNLTDCGTAGTAQSAAVLVSLGSLFKAQSHQRRWRKRPIYAGCY